jgi:hypothetical protein
MLKSYDKPQPLWDHSRRVPHKQGHLREEGKRLLLLPVSSSYPKSLDFKRCF